MLVALPPCRWHFMWDCHNVLFKDPQVRELVDAYGASDQRLIYDPPIPSPYLGNNVGYNGGNILWKGGDQGTSSKWIFADGTSVGNASFTGERQGDDGGVCALPCRSTTTRSC